MNDLYRMTVNTQYNKTTAYQLLKKAKCAMTQCGTAEVFVIDKKGNEYIALISDYGHLVIIDVTGAVACLRMSERTCRAFRALESQCEDMMLSN